MITKNYSKLSINQTEIYKTLTHVIKINCDNVKNYLYLSGKALIHRIFAGWNMDVWRKNLSDIHNKCENLGLQICVICYPIQQ